MDLRCLLGHDWNYSINVRDFGFGTMHFNALAALTARPFCNRPRCPLHRPPAKPEG